MSVAPLSSGGSPRYASSISYTTQRALRTLELLVFSPARAPVLAGVLGVHPRTARRTLNTLVAERYVSRQTGSRAIYSPTVRLVSLAAQLGSRLPLVVHGAEIVTRLATDAGCGVALVVPSYTDVLVLASAGREAPQRGDLVPAHESEGGRLLLRERRAWRENLGWSSAQLTVLPTRGAAAVVPAEDEPLAAIEVYRAGRPDLGFRATLETACGDLARRLQ